MTPPLSATPGTAFHLDLAVTGTAGATAAAPVRPAAHDATPGAAPLPQTPADGPRALQSAVVPGVCARRSEFPACAAPPAAPVPNTAGTGSRSRPQSAARTGTVPGLCVPAPSAACYPDAAPSGRQGWRSQQIASSASRTLLSQRSITVPDPALLAERRSRPTLTIGKRGRLGVCPSNTMASKPTS